MLLVLVAGAWVPSRAADSPRDLAAQADAAMHAALEAYKVPGGVLVVVKDGKVLVAKGYGVADVERRTPMDAAATRLPVASISKIVTATAMMQLVEQGRVELDDPVNTRLAGFQLASPFPEPIRLRHLLTHTAGFDMHLVGGLADGERQPLGRFLALNIPPLLGPPGSVWLYSNYGMALAGHVVEAVSGQAFEEFATTSIFRPLGMDSSTFVRTPQVDAAMATGYVGSGQPWRPPAIRMPPAAALITTGADMARFMAAHLDYEGIGRGTPLRPETLRLMHARQFAAHPAVPGIAVGFFEQFYNGERALMHDGDWEGYSSRLVLLPARRLGVFVSFNVWRIEPRTEVVRRVVAAVVPPGEGGGTPPAQAPAADLSPATGTYRWNRYPHRGLMHVASPKMEWVMTAAGDGAIDVNGLRFAAAGTDVFRRVDGPGALTFVKKEGRLTHALLDMPFQMGPIILEPIPWYHTVRFQRVLIIVLRGMAATVLVWPIAALVQRWRRRPRSLAVPLAHRLLAATGALPLLLNPFWIRAVTAELAYGVSRKAQLLLLIPSAATLMTIATGYCALAAWGRRQGSPLGRVHYTLVWVTMLLYLWVLNHWNLLAVPPPATR